MVRRVLADRRPVSHVVQEREVSRQCASRWVHRYVAEGFAGLPDRSSRSHTSPTRASAAIEESVLVARHKLRCGLTRISQATGAAERTVKRILHRHKEPLPTWCGPVTEDPIRAAVPPAPL
ncbi:helix-turn-helix domain-containing protein [Specibacter sp. RAF43]|uniref:helix-turn-helix domain-containing protein n=1 Tax=Specibacter sp. RAF43 TaxID=3233057 RepID=UPI003F9B80AD